MVQMNSNIRSELEALKEIIIRTVPVEQIWLFGSYRTEYLTKTQI